MAGLNGFTLVLLVVVAMGMAEVQVFHFETHFRKGDTTIIANTEVEVDMENQYVHTTITPVTGNLISAENVHDFVAGYAAIKNALGTCYIIDQIYSMEEMIKTIRESVRANGYLDMSQRFSLEGGIVIPQTEVGRFGDRIANFCRGFKVEYSEQSVFRKRRSSRFFRGHTMICGAVMCYP